MEIAFRVKPRTAAAKESALRESSEDTRAMKDSRAEETTSGSKVQKARSPVGSELSLRLGVEARRAEK